MLGRMAQAADRLGATVAGYGGASPDSRRGTLTIFHAERDGQRPFDPKPFDDLAEPGTEVRHAVSLLSAAEVEHIEELLTELRPAFHAAGVKLAAWGRFGDYRTNGETVYYSPADAQLPSDLVARTMQYGPGTVTFVPGDVRPATRSS